MLSITSHVKRFIDLKAGVPSMSPLSINSDPVTEGIVGAQDAHHEAGTIQLVSLIPKHPVGFRGRTRHVGRCITGMRCIPVGRYIPQVPDQRIIARRSPRQVLGPYCRVYAPAKGITVSTSPGEGVVREGSCAGERRCDGESGELSSRGARHSKR